MTQGSAALATRTVRERGSIVKGMEQKARPDPSASWLTLAVALVGGSALTLLVAPL
jgi:hypothetical protein